VKVLLKQLKTGLFLKKPDGWTANVREARDFKTTPAALDYSHGLDCGETSIVLKFPDSSHDFEIKNG
jgi:hypothetical protein